MTGAGKYILRPTLRLVDNSVAGLLRGKFDALPLGCSPVVYVYAGGNVTPDDVDGIAPDPVTSAIGKLDNTSGKYHYKAAFLEAGEYTIAFTCEAVNDNPAVDDAIGFSGTTTVTVISNKTTTHDF